MDLFNVAGEFGKAGLAVMLIVQLGKMLGFATDRARVVLAVVTGTGLTILYAFSANALTGPNAFNIAVACVIVTATGAGIYGMASAAVDPKPNR